MNAQAHAHQPEVLARQSFIEMGARERARALLDPQGQRELLGPFDGLQSPWLPRQGIVPQSDDGVVVLRGSLGGRDAVVAALEGRFQGGSIGEVCGAKIAAALELALRDCEAGRPVLPVLLLETGGVRLQEANLGLAVIAEIQSAVVALRRHVPVVAIVAGLVGCFGGMSLVAGLCSHIIVTRQARLGMNGPEVIEQEAGAEELDAGDRRLVWSLIGGEQRVATGLADALVEDDAAQLRGQWLSFVSQAPGPARSSQVAAWRARIEALAAREDLGPQELRAAWKAPLAAQGDPA
ncbi:MAG: biotin-independent malonate decarboxylase subunit beta [Betaproteobacteria bacterium]|nr:biotin-independent malonate decarboxylase subunit beta [Betaproteobacteria bacterium]MBU6513277.1 biotin-independent malonate decarboxylase subunit beta [Betaproteobacteria bacterium]MDE1956443.1 biotin-independent malonate decarboxylase subunit beta [Betaproteobacteria bacterium]MDE2153084.1 biotin-independent malonate decarboxylase subunit beta [Betaproteobacteria bacterium]